MVGNTGHLHIEQLQDGCSKLRVLRMATSQLCLSNVPLSEQALSPGFPLLEELSVATISNDLNASGQPFIDDQALERILKTSHKLCVLDVRGCSRVTDSSLVRVPAWDLTHLYLSGIIHHSIQLFILILILYCVFYKYIDVYFLLRLLCYSGE